VDTLLHAAFSGPSAMNRQPWEFFVITDPALRRRLCDSSPYADYDSPLIIVVAGDMRRTIPGAGHEFWVQDCAAAVENILLQAVELGLGSVWCGLYPAADRAGTVRDILQAGPEIVPLGLIHLGHSTAAAQPRDQYDESKVHRYE